MSHKYIPGMGYAGAELMILGEAPGQEELLAGKPFVGASGRELDKLLREAGINRNDCWVTNVCKYYIPASPRDKKIPFTVRCEWEEINIQEQVSELQNEINQIRPNCILALGGTALWALTGKTKISNYRGSILYGMGRKVVATYHPAHLLHQKGGEIKGYWNRQVMIFDFKRAKEEAITPELNLPKRILSVCRNSAQLEDFIQRHKNHERLAVDIEAVNCIPSCIGIAFTAREGLSIPLWNSNGISTIPDSDLVGTWITLSKLLADNEIVGQNFKYDQDKIARLGFSIGNLYSDTMLKAFTINPELPKSLAFNTSIYTREPYYKDEGRDFNIAKQSIDDLFIYNARDACVTKEIDIAMDADLDELGLRDFYNNFVIKLHNFYLGIENEGFYIDREARDKLFDKYIKWSEKLSYELYTLVGDTVNVNSPKQVGILLWEVMKLSKRAGTGEEEITAILNSQSARLSAQDKRILEIILEKRRVEKTIGTYLAAMPDFDGKMKTTYYLCLETGRTSTGQLEPPIRPMIEVKDENNKKKKKAIGAAFQTITKHGDIGQDIRSQYVPEKGFIFVNADSAQAEARVVFLLADDEQALKDIDTHDYHALTASWFFGGVESDYSKKALGYESPIRFAGKTLRHAGHLGAGKRRAATELNTQARKYKIPISITEAIADKALKIFHKKQPNIQSIFHGGIIDCINKTRILTAPVPYGINSKYGGKRTFFERHGDELFRQAFSYIPQRAVSDNTKAAGLRLKERFPNLRIVLEAHDSLLFMIRESEIDEMVSIIKEEFERPINFENCSLPRRELVIPCEVEVGHNYMELKKYD
jgi:uracil-DNA glycosylase family 4